MQQSVFFYVFISVTGLISRLSLDLIINRGVFQIIN